MLASAAPGSLTNDETFTLVPPLRPRRLDGLAFWLALPVADGGACSASSVRRPSSARRRTTGPRRCSPAGSRACRPASSSRCTATGARRRGSTARPRGACSLSSATRSRAAALRRADAVRTVSPFTAGSCASSASSRRRTSRRTWTSSRSTCRRGRCRSSRSRSSSACSRRTRTSTGSRTPGGSRRRAFRTRRSTSSARERARTSPRRSSATCGAAGTASSRRTRSPPRWTPRGCSCCRRARRGWGACSSRRSAAAAESSARAPARSRTSSWTGRAGCSSPPAIRRRSPTRSCACLSDRALAERLGRRRTRRGGAVAADAGGVRAPDAGARRRVRTLVFITQSADPAHPVLGATLPKIRALAERVDEVVVLADTVVPEALPENCRARSFAASSQAGRGARLLAALAPEITRRPVAVVAHMAPSTRCIAAPLARPLRVPLLLWFTQQARRSAARRAERVVDAVLTVDERSVPLRSPKVHAIGHGIDVDALPCVPERRPPLRRLLGLGRYAPVKGWETVLRALPELPDATLTLHGPMLTDADRAHRPRLERLADELAVARPRHVRRRDRVRGGAAPVRARRRRRQRDARQRGGQGRLRGRRRVPAGLRGVAGVRHAAAGAAALPRRLPRLARREDPRLRRRRRPGAARARRRGALRRAAGRDRVLEVAGA